MSAVVSAVRRVPPAPRAGAALGAAPGVRAAVAREVLRAALALGAAAVWGALVLLLGG